MSGQASRIGLVTQITGIYERTIQLIFTANRAAQITEFRIYRQEILRFDMSRTTVYISRIYVYSPISIQMTFEDLILILIGNGVIFILNAQEVNTAMILSRKSLYVIGIDTVCIFIQIFSFFSYSRTMEFQRIRIIGTYGAFVRRIETTIKRFRLTRDGKGRNTLPTDRFGLTSYVVVQVINRSMNDSKRIILYGSMTGIMYSYRIGDRQSGNIRIVMEVRKIDTIEQGVIVLAVYLIRKTQIEFGFIQFTSIGDYLWRISVTTVIV